MPTLKQGGAERVRRYRKQRVRVDYFPNEQAASIIERFKEAGLDNCLQGVIDQLVIAGARALRASAGKDNR